MFTTTTPAMSQAALHWRHHLCARDSHGVAYGMTMPESDVVIHQPNESLVLDDLEKATAIFADAIYRLVK